MTGIIPTPPAFQLRGRVGGNGWGTSCNNCCVYRSCFGYKRVVKKEEQGFAKNGKEFWCQRHLFCDVLYVLCMETSLQTAQIMFQFKARWGGRRSSVPRALGRKATCIYKHGLKKPVVIVGNLFVFLRAGFMNGGRYLYTENAVKTYGKKKVNKISTCKHQAQHRTGQTWAQHVGKKIEDSNGRGWGGEEKGEGREG